MKQNHARSPKVILCMKSFCENAGTLPKSCHKDLAILVWNSEIGVLHNAWELGARVTRSVLGIIGGSGIYDLRGLTTRKDHRKSGGMPLAALRTK